MRDNVEELELHPQTGTFPLKHPKKTTTTKNKTSLCQNVSKDNGN